MVNAAVGWQDPEWEHAPYPLHKDTSSGEDDWSSCVDGVGTGLGISSIRLAAEWYHSVSHHQSDCIRFAVDAEKESGVLGGWQDAAGALYPGGKLIASQDHKSFDVTDMTEHPVWRHIVLFDTGIRRNGGLIGDSVRRLIENGPRFREFLGAVVEQALQAPYLTSADITRQAVADWDAFCEWVPAMHVDVPFVADTPGYMLCGAGGGGFGLYFTHTPEDRLRVIYSLIASGLPAWEPILLPGIGGD